MKRIIENIEQGRRGKELESRLEVTRPIKKFYDDPGRINEGPK